LLPIIAIGKLSADDQYLLAKEWREREQVIQLYQESCDSDISAFINEIRNPF